MSDSTGFSFFFSLKQVFVSNKEMKVVCVKKVYDAGTCRDKNAFYCKRLNPNWNQRCFSFEMGHPVLAL